MGAGDTTATTTTTTAAAAAAAEVMGWETPKGREHRIPAVLPCPPPPRKKKTETKTKTKTKTKTNSSAFAISCGGTRRPKSGYFFCPPDLETLFSLAPRRPGKAFD